MWNLDFSLFFEKDMSDKKKITISEFIVLTVILATTVKADFL